jgi:hypothetical protein
MRRTLTAGLAALAIILIPGLGSSDLLFDGAEFQINSYTTFGQYGPAARSVARAPDGSFVVVWQSNGQDGSYSSVHGQRFDSAGAPAGTEFQINTFTTGLQAHPAVAQASDGSFVVVWDSYGQDGSFSSVHGQRFDSAGAQVGTEFQVNTYTTNDQSFPVVAQASGGSFVVVWNSYGQDGSSVGVHAQRFDSAGAAAGTEFQVNTYTTSLQGAAAVAQASDGSFVVVWQSNGQDGSYLSVHGQRFDSAGAPAGTEFQVNTYTTSYQYLAAVAQASDGSFVVVWQSNGQDGSYTSVHGQRFDSAGAAAGTEFQINTYTTYLQGYGNSIAADAAGDFVVVWASNPGQDGSSAGMFGQRLCQDTNANLICDSAETTTTTTTTTTTSTTTTTTLPGPLCGPAPEPDGACNLADPVLGPGKSPLSIKNDMDNTKDSFKWKWGKGVATVIGDFQTPTAAGSTYRVCLYDASASPQPLLEAEIPNGIVVPTCGTQPCWKPSGTTGFKYKDSAAAADGITGVKLKAGTSGKSQVQVKGKGTLLGPPSTGTLSPNVVVQLLIDDGITTECFKTTFSTVTLQSATQYKAKGP